MSLAGVATEHAACLPRRSAATGLRRSTPRGIARSGASLCLAPVLALALSWALPARAGADLVAGTLTNSPPLVSYEADGQTLQGAIVDLAAALSPKLGRTIVFKPIPFAGLIPALQARHIDIAFTLINDTPEREAVLDFVDFFNLGTMLLVKKGNPLQVDGLDTLCGKNVSAVQGSTQVSLAAKASADCTQAGKPALNLLQYAQPAEARLQVQTGHVAAFMGNSPVMIYMAGTAGNGKLFDVVSSHEYQPVPLGIAVPKDQPALRDALQQALKALIADGSYGRILARHGIERGAVKAAVINGGKDLKW